MNEIKLDFQQHVNYLNYIPTFFSKNMHVEGNTLAKFRMLHLSNFQNGHIIIV